MMTTVCHHSKTKEKKNENRATHRNYYAAPPRELVSASEMATMFEVSKRTIFRDIDTLAMANIPIYTIAGTKGGIGIMPTYKSIKSF